MDIEITEISHITALPFILMYSYIIRELKVTCLLNAREKDLHIRGIVR